MAKVIEPLSDAELKKIAVANLREEYRKLSNIYMRIMNEELIYCPHCGTWKNTNSFYSSNESPDGIEHYACKECILNMMTDYDSRSKIRTDNKEKTIAVFKKLNWYFNEKLYNDQIASIAEGTNEKLRSTGAQQLLTIVKSLKQYRDKTYADSEFDIESVESDSNQEDTKIVQKTIKNAKKRFGSDYTNEQLMYLEQEYQDWITRYECNTKAQEEIFKNLSTNRLERKQAVKQGKPTKEIDKTFQELLAAQNIQPRQSGMDTFADAQTFGTLLQKYEETRPLPEIDESLKDVDNIGLYLDTFYKGNILKCLGLKNPFHHLYEKIMKLFTVDKPEIQEDEDTSSLFEFIFGKDEEE